jgi:hypothetical protein
MPFCVVEDWVMLDAILTEEEQSKVAAAECQPKFVFAHKVVHDEQRRSSLATGEVNNRSNL